ncbi:hypothetical protein ACWOUW_004413 [Vibrio vulnificus]
MGKKKGPKYRMLESVVIRSGDKYQEASSVLASSDGNLWVACINASLAIEIYLKSFLITKHKVLGYSGFKGTDHKSHDLARLYKKLHPKKKAVLLKAVSKVSPNTDLVAELTRYRNVFTNARYTFESNNVESMGTGIVDLAMILRNAVWHIKEVHYPEVQPSYLEQAVNEALSKR